MGNKIVLVIFVMLLLFVGMGCIGNQQTSAPPELDKQTKQNLENALTTEINSRQNEGYGGLELTRGKDFKNNKQYTDARDSFTKAESYYLIAEGKAISSSHYWSNLFSTETNETMKQYYTLHYWMTASYVKVCDSESKYAKYMSLAMDDLTTNNLELANKNIDLANEEAKKISQLIDNYNIYVNKAIQFEIELGMRPPNI